MPETSLCRHFASCGGCSLQDIPDDRYAALKRERVVTTLARQAIETSVEETIRVAPHTRRRCVFKAKMTGGLVALGFHAATSYVTVDMQECLVLTPSLFALTRGLRQMLAELLGDGGTADLHVTEAENGFDIAIRWPRKTNPALVAAFAPWMTRLGIARLIANGEIASSLEAPFVHFAGVELKLPPDAFLQPTKSGEEMLQNLVSKSLKGAKRIADLFAGCGTFSLALGRSAPVHAVESERTQLAALSEAARHGRGLKPLSVEARDLFKSPLSVRELARFDAVVLDPPRAGAQAQASLLAQTAVSKVTYVSCHADSFARDARILIDGGYRLKDVTPVDQFLWSDHIELVGVFARERQ